MNFDNIAELVHELAKSPNRSSVEILKLKFNCEMTNCELNAIAKVFSQEKLSGHSLAAIMQPTLYWV